jgi:hypothetical protein
MLAAVVNGGDAAGDVDRRSESCWSLEEMVEADVGDGDDRWWVIEEEREEDEDSGGGCGARDSLAGVGRER